MVRVGIDLGTTNTAVAMVYADGPHLVPRGHGRIIPSAVLLGASDTDVRVGEEAAHAGARAVRSVKRLMGRTYGEAIAEGSARFFPLEKGSVRLVRRGQHALAVEIAGGQAPARTFWPHEISAHVLAEAKRHAEAHVGDKVEALVTVPAYFRDPHRAATLDAARAAGLPVFGALLDEPTAAALAFAPRVGLRSGEPVLVVDWGGGTLDVTVLTSGGAEWFQNAIDGDLVLGGDDVDHALALLALRHAGLGAEVLEDETNRWSLLEQARRVKELLSEREEAALVSARLFHPDGGGRLPPVAVTITRTDFEGAIAPLLDRVFAVVERCLERPNADREGIRKILLVGGSSRIPSFRRRLQAIVPGARLHDEIDPMQAVALGAAMHAAQAPSIARISPYGYAVLDDDGKYTDVIPPDTETPTPEHLRFAVPTVTRYLEQTVYRLTLAPFTEHGRGLRTFNTPRRLFARGMPPTNVGTRVDVEVWLDENKDLAARCHVMGKPGEHRLEGREDAEGELFSHLLDATLEGEALVEANRRVSGGLLEVLRSAVTSARSVEESRDRVHAEEVLQHLTDLHDQVDDHYRRLALQAQPEEEADRERLRGWLGVFEYELLPEFWNVLPQETRDDARKKVDALRTMLATGAPSGSIWATLEKLRDLLFAGELGPAARAAHDSFLLGMPDRLGAALRTHALLARHHKLANRRAALHEELETLLRLLSEAGAAWRTWAETGPLLEASPDLKVLHRDEGPRH